MSDIIFFIFAFLGALGGLSMMVFLFLTISKQEHNAKQVNNLYPGFTFRCGGRFDGITLTYPIVKVQLDETNILITYTGVDLLLQYQNIESEILKTTLFSGNGIKIIHYNTNYPKEILLFTPYYELLDKFVNGFTVHEAYPSN